MLIILLRIFFGLAILAALGVSISILISMIFGPSQTQRSYSTNKSHDKAFKFEGKYTTRSYQYE